MCGRQATTSTSIASTLATTMTELTMADFCVPAISSAVQASVTSTAGRLIHAPVHDDVIGGIGPQRRIGEHRRNVQTQIADGRSHVARPADRDQRGREQVLEHDAPADDPGDELAKGRIGVGVRAAGHRHHGRVLGVAQPGEKAGDAGQDEAQRHRRPGVEGRDGAGQHEDARADRVADAKGGEVEYSERAPRARDCRRRALPLRSVSIDFRDHTPMCAA